MQRKASKANWVKQTRRATIATVAEEAASKGIVDKLYQTTSILSGRRPSQSKPIHNEDRAECLS